MITVKKPRLQFRGDLLDNIRIAARNRTGDDHKTIAGTLGQPFFQVVTTSFAPRDSALRTPALAVTEKIA